MDVIFVFVVARDGNDILYALKLCLAVYIDSTFNFGRQNGEKEELLLWFLCGVYHKLTPSAIGSTTRLPRPPGMNVVLEYLCLARHAFLCVAHLALHACVTFVNSNEPWFVYRRNWAL